MRREKDNDAPSTDGMVGLELRRLGLNIGVTFVRQLTAVLLQLVMVILIGRLIGPQAIGVYAVAMLLPGLLTNLLNLGISPANVYYVASRQVTAEIAWSTTLSLTLLQGLAGLLIGAAVIIFKGEAWFSGVSGPVLWIALCSCPFALLSTLAASIFQGLQAFRLFNAILLADPILTLAGILGLAALGRLDVESLMLAVLAGKVLTTLIVLGLLRKRLRAGPGWWKPSTGNYMRDALRYGYKAHLSNLLTFLIYRIDLFLVNFFSGPAAAGVYFVAVRMTELLWMPSQAISTVLIPRLSELSHDEDKRRGLTPLIARFALWLTFAGALVIAALAYPLTKILFGAEFTAAVSAILFLLPGIVLGAGGRVLANDAAARGMVGINMVSAAVIVVVNALGNIALIPSYGIDGAAAATSFAYAVNFILRLVIQQWITGVRWWRNIVLRAEDFDLLKRWMRREAA